MPWSIIKCLGMTLILGANAAETASADALNEYELHYIGFEEDGSTSRDRWTTPYEGKLKKPLIGVDFYQKLGRQDLVDAFKSRRNTKAADEVIGGSLVMVGGILAWVGFTSVGACPVRYDGCEDQGLPHNHESLGYVGIGTALLGGFLLAEGILMDPNPVSPRQARQLADEYNQKLKDDVGIPQSDRTPQVQASKVHVAVAPFINRSGGGFSLGISF